MTIRPTSTGYVMACDDCGYTRPVRDAADVACAVRCGWTRRVPNSFDKPTEHQCPKCSAVRRRAAA